VRAATVETPREQCISKVRFMEQFFVTKKKYDWIVRHSGEEYDLTDDREAAIESALRRARAVIASGGQAEVKVANVLGMWDTVDILSRGE
jgi:hypothetical protein